MNITRGAALCLLLSCGAGIVPARAPRPAKEWRTGSFLEFVEGTPADGGVNTYAAADGTVRLINLWDLNSDGNLDVVLAATHDNDEKIDLTVYWGNKGFAPERKLSLPTQGGKAVAVGDLDRDGRADLVVANNFDGTRTDLASYVYWGSPAGLRSRPRTELPTQGAEAVAIADLDADGFQDIVFANSGLSYHVAVDRFNQSFVYWGARAGFSASDRTALRTVNARGVQVADLDRDGVPEIVFAEEGNDPGEGGARIYWGARGRAYGRTTQLPGEHSSAVAVADLDADGRPEIVVANAFRLRGREIGIYNIVDTVAIPSYIYWADASGYSAGRRTELPTVGASGVAVGDFDGDGRPDVAFSCGSGGASYVYWNGPDGFRPNRRLALPTSHASACLAEDLDRDGRADLVFAQASDGRSHRAASRVYWGTGAGLDARRRSDLPTLGATGVAAGDLDGNRETDLVFANKQDGTAGAAVDSWIYWGDARGRFAAERRQSLPTTGPNSYAAADLDNDGFVDLFIPERTCNVYWGSAQGYVPSRRSTISSRNAFSARPGDFDRDGYLDLVLSEWEPGGEEAGLYHGGPSGFGAANRFVFKIGSVRAHAVGDLDKDGWLDVVFSTTSNQVVVYWNGPQGFDNTRKTVLPGAAVVSVELADLDADGFLEVIVANLWDTNPPPGKARSFGGSPEGGTLIYWGGTQGYAASRRTELPSVGNEDIAAADLDRDGRLDLVLTSYHAGTTRSHPSYVYWNGPGGFDPKRVTMLETNSASGVFAADLDRDGFKDLFFTCHSKDGNHRTDSFLYWGGESGYSTARRSTVPGLGPHFMTVADIGQIYDRGERYDWVSRPFDAGANVRLATLGWQGDAPFRTGLEFQVRTAASRDGLASVPWQGPKGPRSFFRTSPAALGDVAPGRWVQWKATLVSPDSVNTPVLRSVSIRYEER